jgi:DNA repair protein RadD
MPVHSRPYQLKLERDTYSAWNDGAINVMPVAATGSGKTVVLSKLILENDGASAAIAHRQELVSQMSLALARNGVRHRVVGPDNVAKLCRQAHMQELGYHFIDPNARCGVCGVDSLVNLDPADPWLKQVTLQVQDEGHHVLKENKWGRAALMMPNARGLFPTATPKRADRKGLGRHADGLVDRMVLAPTMREIINMGYLTDYRIFAPPSDLDLSNVKTGESGDFVKAQLSAAVKKSHLTGDVVEHYLRIAKGKLGVTFCAGVEHATATARAYREAGVSAEVVSAKTPDLLRQNILRKFKRREVLQLVNVDLFGEGFDLPAIEVVSMARPTQSFSLYSQQFGRSLRLMIDAAWFEEVGGVVRFDALSDAERRAVIAQSSKPRAIVIDHVENVIRHKGPPDRIIEWSLDRGETRTAGGELIPYRICPECTQPYPRTLLKCEHCNHTVEPTVRSGPEHVDGDLFEMDDNVLAFWRGEIDRIDNAPRIPGHLDAMAASALKRRHWERQQAQAALRNAMAWYSGLETARGRPDMREQWKRFYFTFGVDVATAQTLNAADAEALRIKIALELGRFGIDATVSAALH